MGKAPTGPLPYYLSDKLSNINNYMKKILLSMAVAILGLSASAATQTFSFSSIYSYLPSDGKEVLDGIPIPLGDVTITFKKGTNSSTAPTYYANGASVRAYYDNTMTVSANGKSITSVKLTTATGGNGNSISTNVPTYNSDNLTWTGDSDTVIFTIGQSNEGKNSGQLRFSAIEVTYDGDGGTTDPGTTPEPVTLTSNLKDLKSGDSVTATAVVTALDTRGFVLTDDAGSILYYNTNVSLSDYPIGTAVEVSGTVSVYNRGLQLDNTATLTKKGTYNYTYPTPTAYTAAMVDEACAGTDDFAASYVSLKGKLSVDRNYYNIIVEGATAQGSVYYVTDDLKATLADGEEYTFEGYFTAVSGTTTKYFNIVLVKATKEGDSGNTPGTPDTPEGVWTVAQALKFLEGNNEGEAVVKGIISEIQEIDTGQYGNATYFIKDNLNDEASLEVFRGYYLDGEKFTSEDQLAVGATVEVSGKLLNYNGTYEFTSGSKLLSYTAPTGDVPTPEQPTYTVTEALDEIGNGYQGNAYVEGYIISIKEVSTQYGNATFTIADNMTYTEGLTVFRTKYLNGAAFTSSNQIAVGGKVKVYGYLTIYDSNAEVTAAKMIEYTAPEGGSTETPETPGGVETVIYSETFADSLGEFTTVGELPEGLNYVWAYAAGYGAKASAYVNGTRYDVASWLVSPEIDLAGYTDIYITFDNALNYLSGNPAVDFVGVYVGAAGSTPSESGWTNISDEVVFGSGSDWTFVNSGEVPLAGFDGQKVQIAFLYSSNTEVAPTWEIKNFTVNGTTVGAGVKTVGSELDNTPVEIYNLQGVKVQNPVKGQIYIINGKKVLLK